MSSTLISKVEQGTVEELEKALTEAKAKGATHFQIGQSRRSNSVQKRIKPSRGIAKQVK